MSGEPIKSAERTLVLFELFALEQRPLSIKEIASAMEMPQSSTSVLVKSLVSLGYLEHDSEDRNYYPTIRIALLGTWMRRRHEQIGRVPRLLSKVAENTGESAVISMRNGIYTQHLFTQIGPDPLRLHIDTATSYYPLACTAPGWVLMSSETDQEIGKIIRRTQAEAPVARWRDTAAEAIDQIEFVRQNGFAISRGQTVKDVAAISVPIKPKMLKSSLTASVGGPVGRIHKNQEKILESLRAMVEAVTSDEVEEIVSNAPPPPQVRSA